MAVNVLSILNSRRKNGFCYL